jgi:hypothetical protein
MGQYYKAVILHEGKIVAWICPGMYNNGAKLTEHSYVRNQFMRAVERAIRPGGKFYKMCLVWAGDYADSEVGEDKNLYTMTEDSQLYYNEDFMDQLPYIVNHTQKEYVVMPARGKIHPLSLLTVEGNGRGGGDYHGDAMVGQWARESISMEGVIPEGYTERVCRFEDEEDEE